MKMRWAVVSLIDILIRLFGQGAYIFSYFLGWRFVSITGKVIGSIFYVLFVKKRKIIEEELNTIFFNRFDSKKIKDVTKRSFENYYMRQMETIFFGSLNKKILDKIIHVEGLRNLDIALSEGKGVILLLSHFGSFLLPLPFLGFMGYKINQVTGKQKHTSVFAERIWEWRKNEADRLPVRFIQVDAFLRPIYESLKSNEIVAIAFDGKDGSKYQQVRLLNGTALVSPGPINLALKTGAAIIPTFIVRKNKFSHRLILGKPFEFIKSGPAENVIFENTERYSQLFADFISKYPCHYGVILQIMRKDSEKRIAKPFSLNK